MFPTPKEIVSDEEMDVAFGYANFGPTPKRDVLNEGALKAACGYHNGSTMTAILNELGLTRKSKNPQNRPYLTKKGREYVWSAYGQYGNKV